MGCSSEEIARLRKENETLRELVDRAAIWFRAIPSNFRRRQTLVQGWLADYDRLKAEFRTADASE